MSSSKADLVSRNSCGTGRLISWNPGFLDTLGAIYYHRGLGRVGLGIGMAASAAAIEAP